MMNTRTPSWTGTTTTTTMMTVLHESGIPRPLSRVAATDQGQAPGSNSRSKSLEATPRIELGIEVLQTSALPLGYVAADSRFYLCPRTPQLGH